MTERYAPEHPDLDRLLADLDNEEASRLREVWEATALAAPSPVFEPSAGARTEAVLAALAVSPQRPGRAAADRRPVPGRRSRRILAAGMLALAALVAFVVVQQPVVVRVPAGEVQTVTLPDGSVVTLNGGTTLERARFFTARSERAVILTGEAFFDVTHSSTPFVVRTFDASVTVLGTTFGVRAWPDDPEPATTVALETGRVRLTGAAHPEEELILAPGEVARVQADAGPTRLSTEAVTDRTAWRQGDFVYKDQPLGLVLRDVERRFGVRITAPEDLSRRHVSVALRTPGSADEVVRDLATALGLRYRARSDGFELLAGATAPTSP